MSRSVVFQTPGELDLRAITTFGINAKPNHNSPIGFFGTGLKYAIAVCMREGLPVTIYTKGSKYTFTQETEEFRDKNFGFIWMLRQKSGLLDRPKPQQMPFTTELGKTWKLWQAYRELYSNTLDENGHVFAEDDFDANGISGETFIVVGGEAFIQEHYDRDKIFLPDASRVRDTTFAVEHFKESSKHIYYRSMRVMDLEMPSLYTYNILGDLELTEDRTAKYSHSVEQRIREYIIQLDDADMIKSILKAPEGTFEQRLNFNGYHYATPSNAFMSTARSTRSSNTTVRDLVTRYEPKEEPTEHILTKLREAIDKGLSDDSIDWIRNNDTELVEALGEAGF